MIRRDDSVVLLINLVGQYAQRGEVVLDRFKGAQYCLPIACHCGIVFGSCLISQRAASAGVKEHLAEGWPDRPETARPRKPLIEVRRLKPASGTEREPGIIGG